MHHFGPFLVLKALRVLKGPQIKFSHRLLHRPYRHFLKPLSLFVLSQSGLPKKRGGRGDTSCDQYIYIGVTIFLEPRLKLDEKWSRRSEIFGWVTFLGVVTVYLQHRFKSNVDLRAT